MGHEADWMKRWVAGGRRRLGTGHRAGRPGLLLLVVQEAVFEGGAHARRRTVRPQRQAVAFAIDEAEYLRLDDVGDFADRAFEQRGVFEQRQLDLAIAVGRKHFTGDTVELLPGRAVDRQYIIESADGLETIRHVLELL